MFSHKIYVLYKTWTIIEWIVESIFSFIDLKILIKVTQFFIQNILNGFNLFVIIQNIQIRNVNQN